MSLQLFPRPHTHTHTHSTTRAFCSGVTSLWAVNVTRLILYQCCCTHLHGLIGWLADYPANGESEWQLNSSVLLLILLLCQMQLTRRRMRCYIQLMVPIDSQSSICVTKSLLLLQLAGQGQDVQLSLASLVSLTQQQQQKEKERTATINTCRRRHSVRRGVSRCMTHTRHRYMTADQYYQPCSKQCQHISHLSLCCTRLHRLIYALFPAPLPPVYLCPHTHGGHRPACLPFAGLAVE